MVRLALALATLFVFGVIKLPAERALFQQRRQLNLGAMSLDLSLREQIGQMGFVAALSGFRAVVADVLFIQAHVAWERTEWGRLLTLFRQVTTLQPRVVLFWDMAAWHMAWNASVAAMNDAGQPRQSLRINAQRECFALGKEFLEDGIRNNPDQPKLYESLARLYQDKYNDHARASEFFAKAAALSGAPSYDRRFSAYELSYCEGREQEAYQRLRELYDEGEKERLPTLIRRLKFLENKLDTPAEQRIRDAER